jgi:hypothetical protein
LCLSNLRFMSKHWLMTMVAEPKLGIPTVRLGCG